ncbi:MAG: class I SAM-dependent methyltransferase [Anaerolineae bacterium]|nr:class I SAM-dependent methyltransferase [Anaerolineales bacterium]MCQ3975335.1 class I SAM-dependent methyltransferase [Anaerolineae bacterium]
MSENLQEILEEQKAYYRARAQEYDEWFYRRGRYHHGPEHTQKWEAEAAEVRQALAEANLTGQVLDIAAGTGIWTQELIKTADHVTALDSSEEMVALNRARLQSDKVTYTLTDLFYWQPVMAYDGIFMGFWLSHVPPALLYDFIGTVAGALKPGGKLFFVDSLPEPTSTAKDMMEGVAKKLAQRETTSQVAGQENATMTRRLNDGREFQVVKVYYLPDDLADRLASYEISATVKQTENFFLYGWGTKQTK